jgi:putative pyruvate formate lyase activating enzyme
MMAAQQPSYLELHRSGQLQRRLEAARENLRCCTLCPRECRVDRLAGETGVCNTAEQAWISSFNAHFGEESPLVGSGGSGTIFFTHCNLLCVFCQNYEISHLGEGRPVTAEQLAAVMLELQNTGCHNINFVTPSHVVAQILEALPPAVEDGLRLPLVYNSGGYDKAETLRRLEGIVDIYMPDFKFWDPEVARSACNAPDYPERARSALREMHRQVGDLVIDEDGIARRGLLVRHLVMPHGIAGTSEIMRFIADEISTETYVNIMRQYRPCGRAAETAELADYPTPEDFDAALESARRAGIHRLDRLRRVFRLW